MRLGVRLRTCARCKATASTVAPHTPVPRPPCLQSLPMSSPHAAPVRVQAVNLRSQVSKMTCVTIAELAVTLQQEFECVVDPIVVALLKLPKVTKEVGAD
jgi:hypothetical protein